MRRRADIALKCAVVLIGTLLCSITWAADAVVVDRYGNQHKVERFTYQGRQDIEAVSYTHLRAHETPR